MKELEENNSELLKKSEELSKQIINERQAAEQNNFHLTQELRNKNETLN